MAAFTSKATGNWNTAGQTTWNEVGTPGAGDTVTIQNTHVVTQVQNEACAGCTVDVGGELDMATFNLANSALTTINGTLTMGVSADTGLTTVGFTVGAAATLAGQTTSLINNSGNLIISAANRINPAGRFTYTQTGDGTYNVVNANVFYSFGVADTYTLTAAVANQWIQTTLLILNGTFDKAAFGNISIVVYTGGTITFDANSDLAGTGNLNWHIGPGVTYNYSKVGAFTFTGTIRMEIGTFSPSSSITGDFSNAVEYRIVGAGGARVTTFTAGTLKCALFTVFNNANGNMTITNSTNNPSFEIGNIGLNGGIGIYTTTWIKGSGTITWNVAVAATGDFNGQTVEALTKTGAGTAQLVTSKILTQLFLLSAGIIDYNGQDMETIGNYTIPAGGGTVTPAGLNGSTITVGGNYSVAGTATTLLDLLATAAWTLTVTGTASASYVKVRNSNAGGGTAITATNSIDYGSNTNWIFDPIDLISNRSTITQLVSNTSTINQLISLNSKVEA